MDIISYKKVKRVNKGDVSMDIWRDLRKFEEEEFRQWARDNWKPNIIPNPLWHPVIIDEWKKLDDIESGINGRCIQLK